MNNLIVGLDNKKPVYVLVTQQPIHILDAVYALSHAVKLIFKEG
jgi:penicillin amidase